MPALDRAALLAVAPRQVTTVDLPGIGQICMRALTGAEVSEIYASVPDQEPAAVTRRIVARSICDESGARILLLDDADALFDKPAAITNPLVRHALDLNRMSTEEADATRKD